MTRWWRGWIEVMLALCVGLGWLPHAGASAPAPGTLVSVAWLQQNLARGELLLIDASPPPMYAQGHIAGAVNVNLFGYAARNETPAQWQQRLQSWGVSPGRKIVVYDSGGTMMAPRVFFDLFEAGVPLADLHLLDGGLAGWRAAGGAVTKEATPPPAPGSFRITRVVPDARVRLPEFLAATGDPANHAVIEALDPEYHFGGAKFFDRAGHVPNAILWRPEEFFNADKTFKSAAEIRRMAAHLGVRVDQQVMSYCGGGVAAAVPFFALRFVAGFPKVSLFVGSQLEWLRDERQLPMWTYSRPAVLRDLPWLAGWANPDLMSFGVRPLAIVDVRPPEAYAQGHVPNARNVPAAVFREHLKRPQQLAETLAAAGVRPELEAVITSQGGLNRDAALALVMLERAGQKNVAILLDAVDEWALRGLRMNKEPSPARAVPAAAFATTARPQLLLTDTAASTAGGPRVFVASGAVPPTLPRDAQVVRLTPADLLDKGGQPKPAAELWSLIAKAGVPRFAELVVIGEDPGDAAINYVVLRLMGFPDVKLMP